LFFISHPRYLSPVQLRHPAENTLPLRYYLMLAEFYASEPSKASEIQQLGVALWNNAHFHLVHSLLLYRWVRKIIFPLTPSLVAPQRLD
jgi:hypothetical protein